MLNELLEEENQLETANSSKQDNKSGTEESNEQQQSKKKQKRSAIQDALFPVASAKAIPKKKEKDEKKKFMKYILFVGNLPYDVTSEDIRKHFAQVEKKGFVL